MRQPRLALAAAAALVGLGALGLGAPAEGADAAAPNQIEALKLSFAPKELAVTPGTKVTWQIREAGDDSQGHWIKLDDPEADCDKDCTKRNDSGQKGPGTYFDRVFNEKGSYPYYCFFHGGAGGQGMSGIVHVTEDGNPPPTTQPTQPPPPPPTTAPPTTAPPATAPPTTAPRPTSPPPPAPAATTTTKPAKAIAAGKTAKPPKTATTQGPTTTTLPPETTTTAPPLALPPLAEKGPLVQAPIVEVTTTTLPAAQSGEDGFVAINKKSRRGGVKKATYAAVGALGLSLIGGGVVWWRRRPSRYWSA